MADFSIVGEITGDTSQFVGAFGEAGDALSSFAAIAGGVATGNELSALMDALTQMASTAVSTATDFQYLTALTANMLGGIAGQAEDVAGSVNNVGKAAADTTQKIADEMDKFQERVFTINQSIQDSVLSTQSRIADLIDSTNSHLEDLAASHADKIDSLNQSIADTQEGVQEKSADRQASIQETLTKMQEDHNLQVGAHETKASAAAFAAKLALKKEQLDREAAASDAKDKEQADKQIAKLNEQIAKENVAYEKQVAQANERLNKETDRINEENDKRLRNLNQQLAKEEEANQKSLERIRAMSTAGGTGGQLLFKTDTDSMRAVAMSREEIAKLADTIHSNAKVLQLTDIEQGMLNMSKFDMNIKTMSPAVMNMALAAHESFTEVASAIDRGTKGGALGLRMLYNQFGIGKDELKKYGAEFNSAGEIVDKGSFLRAVARAGTEADRFKNVIKNTADTTKVQTAALGQAWEDLSFKIIGYDASTDTAIKGGALDTLMTLVTNLTSWMTEHGPDVDKFFEDISNFARDVGERFKWLTPLWNQLAANAQILWDKIGPKLTPALKDLGELIKDVVVVAFGMLLVAASDILVVADKIVTAWTKVFDFFKNLASMVTSLKSPFEVLGNMVRKAFDPTFKQSPSLIENVQSGLASIESMYDKLDLNVKTPQVTPPPSSAFSSNYSNITNNNQQSNPVMNNTFYVANQSSAENIANFLGFQLEHAGIV